MSLLLSLTTLAAFGYAQSFQEECQNLQLSIPNVQVNALEYVADGTNLTFDGEDPTCAPAYQLVYGGDICRVALNVSTSNASNIIMEAWLPSDWNGRFLSTGNGGLAGCIGYDTIAYAASYGFAAVGANNGHNGTSGKPFLNKPGVIEDYVYRSVHTGTVVGKQVTEQLYAAPINHSYYMGCSTGGRQGMKEAQDFPDDFDGIVASAPAFDFNHLQAWSGWLSSVAGFDNTSDTFVRFGQWQVVNAEIIRQCDALDGAKDGIIEDPDLCRPVLEGLICAPNATNTSTCLNSGQYARVIKTLEPLYNTSGTLIYPRLQPGAHGASAAIFFTGQPFIYASDWYKYVVYNDSNWDATKLGQADFTAMDRLNPFGVSTWKGDLSSFRDRGGKLITFHGLQDPIISSENSARYYSHLAQTMGLPPTSLDEFYRYFRISGMGHCAAGPGATDVGQAFVGRPDGVSNKNNNVLEAIVAWVEKGEAPEYLEGIKWTNSTPSAGEEFRRRHCKYPTRNMYTGSGDGSDEDGWQCVL